MVRQFQLPVHNGMFVMTSMCLIVYSAWTWSSLLGLNSTDSFRNTQCAHCENDDQYKKPGRFHRSDTRGKHGQKTRRSKSRRTTSKDSWNRSELLVAKLKALKEEVYEEDQGLLVAQQEQELAGGPECSSLD